MIFLLLIACSADNRQQLELPITAEGAAIESVQLDVAQVVVSDIRVEEPAAVAWRPSLIPAAHAHPGHDMSGDTIGELLGTFTVDLLAEPTELGVATALEGELATGRVVLESVLLEGTGPEGQAFSFDVPAQTEIVGIPTSGVLSPDAPPQGLSLGISAEHMISYVDWTTPDTDADGVLTLADGLLGNTVTFGAVSTASFTMTLVE